MHHASCRRATRVESDVGLVLGRVLAFIRRTSHARMHVPLLLASARSPVSPVLAHQSSADARTHARSSDLSRAARLSFADRQQRAAVCLGAHSRHMQCLCIMHTVPVTKRTVSTAVTMRRTPAPGAFKVNHSTASLYSLLTAWKRDADPC